MGHPVVAWNEWHELRKLAGASALSDVSNVTYSNHYKLNEHVLSQNQKIQMSTQIKVYKRELISTQKPLL